MVDSYHTYGTKRLFVLVTPRDSWGSAVTLDPNFFVHPSRKVIRRALDALDRSQVSNSRNRHLLDFV